ncbi:hypothetical protein BCR36DRAFT_286381 [Piromyces finnis]|uniref:Uncharacterized protein n=1 Tax=Piromyces finnis TaxID=1754191 RepID=A0A1Y1VC85_9FUNG|nr:hypothetical protein BCR36DRAFT_286381 [Piromyces finnis]|eukprot:ORX52505.1 hypothetical protein BCR36DRAFT_286381 [Piromyces finnis]
MNNFNESHFIVDDLIAHSLNIDNSIVTNNIENENSLYSFVKLEPNDIEDCPQNNNYLKVEFSFAKHYNGIGQNVKAYITILNDCFEEISNVKCIISSENYFNTYSFVISSIQINEVIVKEVNLTICDKYLNLDNYDTSSDCVYAIENLIDNLPNNISIRLISNNNNQGTLIKSYPTLFNVTSDFFIKDFLKINKTNEIFNIMLLGPSLENSKNLVTSMKLLFENYNINKIDLSNDETIEKSFSENFLNNEQWPLNIRMFYNKNYNHISSSQNDNKEVLKYIINGYFPNDDSIIHLTKKPTSDDYNKLWNSINTYNLDETMQSMNSYSIYNNDIPVNNKQYINAVVILIPKIANDDHEILKTYKEIADTVAKQGRPTYIILDNYLNNSGSDSSLTEVNDSKEDIVFMNIISEFSMYPIFTTSSYELFSINDNNECYLDALKIKKFKKHMNRDILFLHMMNKMIKDLTEINRNQKMLINPDAINTDILIVLYWDSEYDQNLTLMPAVIGECYSNDTSNRIALITNINKNLDIGFTCNKLDYFNELSNFDIYSMDYENIDFNTLITNSENLINKSNNKNPLNTWIISNIEMTQANIRMMESKLIQKSNDKIFIVYVKDKQDIVNSHNESYELVNSNSKHFLTVENVDSLIEYFSINTKKNNNLVINPRLTLNIIKQYATNDEININSISENIDPFFIKYDFKIPSSISLIKNISKITLTNCKLRGSIPDALKDLNNLKEL